MNGTVHHFVFFFFIQFFLKGKARTFCTRGQSRKMYVLRKMCTSSTKDKIFRLRVEINGWQDNVYVLVLGEQSYA